MAQRLPHCRGTLNQECDRVPAFVHPQDYRNRGTLSRMDFGLPMIFVMNTAVIRILKRKALMLQVIPGLMTCTYCFLYVQRLVASVVCPLVLDPMSLLGREITFIRARFVSTLGRGEGLFRSKAQNSWEKTNMYNQVPICCRSVKWGRN